jgi:hypothetical protein
MQLTGTNSPAGKPESLSPASLPPIHHFPARDPPAPDAKTNPCAQQTSIDDMTSLTGQVGPVSQRAASAHPSVRALAASLLTIRSEQTSAALRARCSNAAQAALSADRQRRRYSVEHRAQRLQRQLEALGYAATVEQVEQPEAEQAA